MSAEETLQAVLQMVQLEFELNPENGSTSPFSNHWPSSLVKADSDYKI